MIKSILGRLGRGLALGALLGLVATIAIVTLAHATPNYHGRYFVLHANATVLANTTFTSDDYSPGRGVTHIALFFDANQAGTAKFFRIDARGGPHQIGSDVAVTSGTEVVQTYSYPINQLRMTFVSTSTTATTTVSLEAIDGPRHLAP
jgi:hypothetical protein